MNYFNRLIVCLGMGLIPLSCPAEQLQSLPLPSDGMRYHSVSELDFQWPATHGAGSVCLWGDDKFGAVSFTIDDNNVPDLPFWRQASQDFGWKFTWFVIVHPYVWDVYNDIPGTNPSYSGTTEQWKALYEEGHDIQLHGNTDLNGYGDPEYEEQLLLATAHMESVIHNQMNCFAYPGGVPAGGIPPGVDRVAIARRHMISARGGTGYAIVNVAKVDYLTVPAIGPAEDFTSTGFWAKMDTRPTNLNYSGYRGWAVVLNHKISNPATTLGVLNFVKTNEAKYWVKPYSHVARYAQERESSTLTVTHTGASKIAFTLTDRMHDELFNVPLTVKFRTNGWTGAEAHQNGSPVPVRLVTNAGATYALVDAVPDRGPVELRATQPDTDNDGMPDLWETENGFNPADPADALLDFDLDGQTNRAEFLADTHPKNSSSRMNSWLERQGDGFSFAFSPLPNWVAPMVETSTDLVTWHPLTPSVVLKEGQVTRWTDPAPLAGRRFYRLRLVEP